MKNTKKLSYVHVKDWNPIIGRPLMHSNTLYTLVEFEFTYLVEMGVLKLVLMIFFSIASSSETNANDDENKQAALHGGPLSKINPK